MIHLVSHWECVDVNHAYMIYVTVYVRNGLCFAVLIIFQVKVSVMAPLINLLEKNLPPVSCKIYILGKLYIFFFLDPQCMIPIEE